MPLSISRFSKQKSETALLDQTRVFDELDKSGVRFYVGVPDSYLNGFCNHALASFPERTVIAANEGNAVGIAAGHWFATGELPLVFMQNSGIGNAVNPLASLVDSHVYAVPMLLLIGCSLGEDVGYLYCCQLLLRCYAAQSCYPVWKIWQRPE